MRNRLLRWIVLNSPIDFGPLAPWLFAAVLGRRPKRVRR